ncbi:GntR family transcriptional regulator [Lichenibacterium dinghuense]|uniref:GntR family transcriptional regulator n=1 Tax=Lichenibacterium dinghuense TaxID=2895977 RepID=UPI001F343837|nr:GntR family transcriptional regulator [Lichenibacterium sp. 6Y81]
MTKITKAFEIQKAIADDIVHGRRAPGTSLDETVLAREFAVSRTPIREAIRQLEMTGLVEARPHRGAVVCDVSPERLDDMFTVMRELEALCARLAAAAMTPEDRASLRAQHDASAALVSGDRPADYAASNDEFHDLLYDASRNAFLAEVTRQVRLRLSPFRRVQIEGPGRMAHSFEEHERIVAAIERGDAAAAEAEMRTHLGEVRHSVDEIDRGETAEAARPRRPRAAKG